DGLCDTWEVRGLQVRGSSTPYSLADASYNRRDLYVETDGKAGAYVDTTGKDALIAAFGEAPVGGTGGILEGIALHLQFDSFGLSDDGWWTIEGGYDDSLRAAFKAFKDLHFGLESDGQHEAASRMAEAKRLAYHYCVAVDTIRRFIGSDRDDPVGIAENLGNDFLIGIRPSTQPWDTLG